MLPQLTIENSNNFNIYECSVNIDNGNSDIISYYVPSLGHLIYTIDSC